LLNYNNQYEQKAFWRGILLFLVKKEEYTVYSLSDFYDDYSLILFLENI